MKKPRTDPGSPSLFLVLALLVLTSCGEDAVPKPFGYFRIDMPLQEYKAWEPACPFASAIPAYSIVRPGQDVNEPCLLNVEMPALRATIYLTYKAIVDSTSLGDFINEAHTFKSKHESMALRINNRRVLRDSARVFGTIFDVEGDVASPSVFYLTDSAHHFLYGSLYFNATPNADSLQPVTHRVREDIDHFVSTLRWR